MLSVDLANNSVDRSGEKRGGGGGICTGLVWQQMGELPQPTPSSGAALAHLLVGVFLMVSRT